MILQLVILVAVVAQGLVAFSINDCPSYLIRNDLRVHGESCYLFFLDTELEFDAAEKECETRGGHLAFIRDMDTQNFLYHALRDEFYYMGAVWIGLTDDMKEGQFTWIDGTPAEYTYWAPGQPGLTSYLEDCVAMNMDDYGRWHDYRCQDDLLSPSRHSFVCEYQPLAPTIDDCPNDLFRTNLRVHGQSCYLFNLDYEREFDTAERECESKGGHLAIIRDMATQNFLYRVMQRDFQYNDSVWIGLSDAQEEGQFIWVDGTPADFTHWASGQPGFFTSYLEDCVAMNMGDGGSWYDDHCQDVLFVHYRHSFICEYAVLKRTTTTPEHTTPKPTTAEPTTNPESTTTEPTTAEHTTNPESTTPEPTTAEPTTDPESTTTEPTTAEPTTSPESTTPEPTTAEPLTPQTEETTDSTGCPIFACPIDCGLAGFKVDENNCLLCECDG